MRPGKLIVLEGIDGSGKTTVAQGVRDKLRLQGVELRLEAEPSQGQVGLVLRDVLRSTPKERLRDVRFGVQLALLMAADRVDHFWNVMYPVLQNGTSILCDRYVWSSYAYQSDLGVDLRFIASINSTVLPPDRVIYIEADPAVARQRIAANRTGSDLFDSESQLKRIAAAYSDLPQKCRRIGIDIGTYSWVDGNADPAIVVEQVSEIVSKLLK